MINVKSILSTLAKERRVFHSEADFQHAFAWEAHRRMPTAKVRLERPLRTAKKTLHLDFLIQRGKSCAAIELKYKTRKLLVTEENEAFELNDHSALDIGRYDYIKDIMRLEEITSTLKTCVGYAILLTNDGGYWSEAGRADTVDAMFRLHEGRVLQGALTWGAAASAGTKRGREAALRLRSAYEMRWHDFAKLGGIGAGRFRCLVVRISPKVQAE